MVTVRDTGLQSTFCWKEHQGVVVRSRVLQRPLEGVFPAEARCVSAVFASLASRASLLSPCRPRYL